MSGVTKSVHPLYGESIVLSIPSNELTVYGIEYWRTKAREHYFADYHKEAVNVEVVKETGEEIFVIARGSCNETNK